MIAAVSAFLLVLMIPQSMAMATATNKSRQGALIALMRARRAEELMRAFARVNNSKKE